MSLMPCPRTNALPRPLPGPVSPRRGNLRLARVAESYAAPAPVAPPRPVWPERLSPREEEVLHCVARGLSNAEIAAELFISLATVKSHVARLLDKLGARDRVQLVVWAFRSGFVDVR